VIPAASQLEANFGRALKLSLLFSKDGGSTESDEGDEELFKLHADPASEEQ